jgi:hypothetical protein
MAQKPKMSGNDRLGGHFSLSPQVDCKQMANSKTSLNPQGPGWTTKIFPITPSHERRSLLLLSIFIVVSPFVYQSAIGPCQHGRKYAELGRGGKSMGGAGQTDGVSGPLCRGGGVRRIGLRVGQAE